MPAKAKVAGMARSYSLLIKQDEATACSPRPHTLSASVTSRPTGGRFLKKLKIFK